MTEETRTKWSLRWYRLKKGVKEFIPPFIQGAFIGTVVATPIVLHNHKKCIQELQTVVNKNADVVSHNAHASRYHVDRIDKELGELRRQNNLLLEKAMLETEGKAE